MQGSKIISPLFRRRSRRADETPATSAPEHWADPELFPEAERLCQIKSAILADLTPVTPLASQRVLLATLLIIAAVILAAGSLLLGLRGWYAFEPEVNLWRLLPVWVGVSVLAAGITRQMAPSGSAPRAAIVWSSLAFTFLTAATCLGFDGYGEPRFFAIGLKCFGLASLHGVIAALFLWLVVRRGAILAPVLTGAMTGALAGFLSLAECELRCPSPNAYHLLVWHLPLVPLGVAAGALIAAGPLLLREALLQP
jgi:hypothetical protein